MCMFIETVSEPIGPCTVYCLVDDVLQCGEIMPDEKKKKLAIQLFFPPKCMKNMDIFIKKVDESYGICGIYLSDIFLFFLPI